MQPHSWLKTIVDFLEPENKNSWTTGLPLLMIFSGLSREMVNRLYCCFAHSLEGSQ